MDAMQRTLALAFQTQQSVAGVTPGGIASAWSAMTKTTTITG